MPPAMGEAESWERLRASSHGVLSTVHPERGVDAVPVVYAVVGDGIAVPVDRVKAKRTTELQRVRNIRRDPRCVLLIDGYDDDWSRLWWVRAHAEASILPDRETAAAADALAARYPAYRESGVIAGVLLLRPTRIRGWRAT